MFACVMVRPTLQFSSLLPSLSPLRFSTVQKCYRCSSSQRFPQCTPCWSTTTLLCFRSVTAFLSSPCALLHSPNPICLASVAEAPSGFFHLDLCCLFGYLNHLQIKLRSVAGRTKAAISSSVGTIKSFLSLDLHFPHEKFGCYLNSRGKTQLKFHSGVSYTGQKMHGK